MSVPHLWASGMHCVAMLVPAPAENLYQSSVKFLSHFLPRPKSLRRSESFRNLYWLHSEAAKNENILEYSSMRLYQRRNVLICHKRWRKRGHGHQNFYPNPNPKQLLRATDFFVGHIELLNGFIRVLFVFRVLLMRSIRCRDKAVRYISESKI